MPNNNNKENLVNLPAPASIEESLKPITEVIMPVVQILSENQTNFQNKQMEVQNKQIEENAKIYTKNMEYNHLRFKHTVYIVFSIFFLIFALVCGLIFYKNDTAAGIQVLSYAGAFVAGILAGFGAKSTINKQSNS